MSAIRGKVLAKIRSKGETQNERKKQCDNAAVAMRSVYLPAGGSCVGTHDLKAIYEACGKRIPELDLRPDRERRQNKHTA